jgi:3-phenylpropionate/trans-cinnamate dioxygenase ferredoxin subunit
MNGWHDVGAVSDLSDDAPIAATIGENEIGLYQVGDRYYAMENICPHAYALLSQGFVEGDEVECALHGARFHIPTGKCTQEPGGRDLVCYAVKREGERLLVKVD